MHINDDLYAFDSYTDSMNFCLVGKPYGVFSPDYIRVSALVAQHPCEVWLRLPNGKLVPMSMFMPYAKAFFDFHKNCGTTELPVIFAEADKKMCCHLEQFAQGKLPTNPMDLLELGEFLLKHECPARLEDVVQRLVPWMTNPHLVEPVGNFLARVDFDLTSKLAYYIKKAISLYRGHVMTKQPLFNEMIRLYAEHAKEHHADDGAVTEQNKRKRDDTDIGAGGEDS